MKKMKKFLHRALMLLGLALLTYCTSNPLTQKDSTVSRETTVTIVGNKFYINDHPTYEGRIWNGYQIEGLLLNSRMVQGIFDDENPLTAGNFIYPDTKKWDPERNTREFIQAMPSWQKHGLLSFTINLQGGSPLGYGNKGWINSAFDSTGNLKEAYMNRLEKILDEADKLGMVPIVGLFYFGQDQILKDDAAVKNAVKNAVEWILAKGYRNVLLEISNECDNMGYDHSILHQSNIHELILLAKGIEFKDWKLPVSTSFNGGSIPTANVVSVSDYILFHGNGVNDPDRMAEIVNEIRSMKEYKNVPVVCNEDDHFDFENEWNHFIATTSVYASWGYFDYRMNDEGFDEGFQSVPVNWEISSERKNAFFSLLKEISGK